MTVDALARVVNDNRVARAGKDALVEEVLALSGELASGTAKGIAVVLANRGNIDISFNDFEGVLSDAGESAFGIGSSSGEGSGLIADCLRSLVKKDQEPV